MLEIVPILEELHSNIPNIYWEMKDSRNDFPTDYLLKKCNNKFLPARGSNIIGDPFLYAEFPKLTKPILKGYMRGSYCSKEMCI